ncbi:MAG: MFS transporter [Actinomycetota bacterium]|nr:MFS transporter [Actinomycetota bacterium]
MSDRPSSLRTPGFLGGVLGTAFTVAVGFGLIVPALPAFARELGASVGATSAVISTFAAVRLVAVGPAGAIADRVGARITVATGLVLVAASSAATALADRYMELVFLRGAGGLGSALFITGLGQYLVVAIPARERGRANGLLHGAFLLGGASGPAVGGLVIEAVGIRAPFVIYAVTLLIATAVTLNYLRPLPTLARDRGGQVVQLEDSPPRLEATGAHGTGRGGSAIGALVRDRTFLAILGVHAVVSWGSQGVRFVGIPLFGEEILGATPGQVGLALATASVTHGMLLWPASHVTDRHGRLLPVRVGTAVFALALAGLATTSTVPMLFVWMAVQGVATGATSTVPAAMVGDLAPAGVEGRAVGAMNVARDVGAIAGPLVTGVVADLFGFPAAFGLAAILLGAGFAATFAMRETLPASR